MTDLTSEREQILRRALLQIKELRAKLARTEAATAEPIAMISTACRFPGGANSPEAYWAALRTGRDLVSEVPASRWDLDRYFNTDPDVPGTMYTRWGGFLDQPLDQFDARFFHIRPREANSLDPQQRLMLEVAWEALERAAHAGADVHGGRSGVFLGVSTNDYGLRALYDDPREIDVYSATGNALNAIAGRIAHFLDWHGPVMAVDTACSSSLVAVHLACQSLRARECDLALAGGVNLLLLPHSTIATSRAKMMSPTGRCHTFDSAADGYVRSEGCGVVMLRRWSDAVEAGDAILGVILASTVNHDGKASALTVPNGHAQAALVRDALKLAGVEPDDVDVVECHGTGTPLGDPIEVGALRSVFAASPRPAAPLRLTSTKAHVGHLEAAAGIASLIKMVLCLEQGAIPAQLHFERPNPHIDFSDGRIQVPRELLSWAPGPRRRVAGISSFGFTGTNAHVVLAEPPPSPAPEDRRGDDRAATLVCLSAHSEPAVRELARRYAARLRATPSLSPASIAFSANVGRAHFQRRLAVIASTTAELADALDRHADRHADAREPVSSGGSGAPASVFVLPGLDPGALAATCRWLGDRKALSDALAAAEEHYRKHARVSLSEAMAGTERQNPEAREALVVVLGLALAAVWRSFGVEPTAAVGAGAGQASAACLAGAITIEDAIVLACARGRLAGLAPAERSREWRKLEVGSRLSAPAEPALRLLCGRTGRALTSRDLDDALWRQELLEPRAPLARRFAEDRPIVVDVGGGGLDLGADRRDLDVLALSPAGAPSWPALLEGLRRFYLRGGQLRWELVETQRPTRVVLPTYPFERSSFWLSSSAAPETAAGEDASCPTAAVAHPLLHRRVLLPTAEIHFTSNLCATSLRYIDDHRIQGMAWTNFLAYVEMAVAGLEAATGRRAGVVRRARVTQALILPDVGTRSVHVVLRPAPDGSCAYEIASRPWSNDGAAIDWIQHADGRIEPGTSGPERDPPIAREALVARCAAAEDAQRVYDAMGARGAHLGPSLRLLDEVHLGSREAVARLGRAAAAELPGLALPLAALDACLQLMSVVALDAGGADLILTDIDELTWQRPVDDAAELWCWVRVREDTPAAQIVDATLFDAGGAVLASIAGGALTRVRVGQTATRDAPGDDAGGALRTELLALPPAERAERLVGLIVQHLARATGTPEAEISTSAPLIQQIDSLIAVELKSKLERLLGAKVPVADILSGSNAAQLATLLGAEMDERAPPPSSPRMDVDTLLAEAVLASDIRPDPAAAPQASPPRAVLLTGATGYLGAFLLHELLARTPAVVHCLVRAPNLERAWQRLSENLAAYRLDDLERVERRRRVRPILGDLAEPGLGIDAARRAALAGEVQAIYHSGAEVKWSHAYSALRGANVAGTHEILRFAAQGVAKPVHFVSTVGVFSSRERANDRVLETDPLESSGPLYVGYAQSKWVSEKLVRLAGERGLPFTVFRPNIGPHSQTGAFNRHDYLTLLLQASVGLGAAPDLRFRVASVPVDFVSRAIVDLSLRPEAQGQTFHLTAPGDLWWSDICDMLGAAGYSLSVLPSSAWSERLVEREEALSDRSRASALGAVPAAFSESLLENSWLPEFDIVNTARLLKDCGLEVRSLDADLLFPWLQSMAEAGLLPRPPRRSPSSKRSAGAPLAPPG